MVNFLHTYLPNPILVQFGPISIHWYGLFVALGIFVSVVVASRLARTYGISSEKVYDAGLYAVLGGLVGARIYAVFLELPYYLAHPFEIIAIWHGGLAIHGGIIGAVAVLAWYCKKNHLPLWHMVDAAAPALALGQAIGRFGNYFNQELFGTPTTLPWGIPIALQNRPEAYASFTYFHPTFLYESFLNLLNFIILFILIKRLPATSYQLKRGTIFFVYLINYAIIRILMEQLRTDVTPEFSGVRVPILVSGLMIVLSVVALGALYKKRIS